jgi:ankyrin repeat protein
VVAELLRRGARLDQALPSGENALMLAAMGGHTAAAAALLEEGAGLVRPPRHRENCTGLAQIARLSPTL